MPLAALKRIEHRQHSETEAGRVLHAPRRGLFVGEDLVVYEYNRGRREGREVGCKDAVARVVVVVVEDLAEVVGAGAWRWVRWMGCALGEGIETKEREYGTGKKRGEGL